MTIKIYVNKGVALCYWLCKYLYLADVTVDPLYSLELLLKKYVMHEFLNSQCFSWYIIIFFFLEQLDFYYQAGICGVGACLNLSS